jgi:hypothetical protein
VQKGRCGEHDVCRAAAPRGETRIGRGAGRTVLMLHEAASQKTRFTRTSKIDSLRLNGISSVSRESVHM